MADSLPVPTNKPVPSSDIRDSVYAGAMLDKIITSRELTYTDRLGGEHYTADGIKHEGDRVIENTRQNLIPLSRQYMSIAEAQADIENIPDGSATYIRSDDGSSLADEYINNGGVLEPTGRKMTSQYALDSVSSALYSSASYQSIKRIPRGPSNIRWGVISGGFWLIAVDVSGVLISTHNHENYENTFKNLGNPVLISAIVKASPSRIPRGPKKVTSGLIVGGLYRWYLDDDGNYVDGISDASDSVYAPGVVRSDIGTGQSLALGSRGFINTAPGGAISGQVFSSEPSRHGDLCLMLNGEDSPGNSMGVRVFVNNDNYTPPSIDDFTGVQPIYERWDNGVLGETIWSAYANSLMTSLKNEKNVSFRLLPIVSGKGASTYNSLKRGTNVWNAMFAAIDAAQYLVEERGWIYRVGDLDTMHGEAEINTTQAEYEGYCREWLSDFRTDAVSRTGQTARSIKMTFSQCSTGGTASEGVAAAQINLHETDDNFILYCPKYQFPYYDAQHMLAEGYVKVGELRARAKRFMLNGKKWDCLRPVAAVLSGTTLTVKFNNSVSGDVNTAGPIGSLVLDTLRGKNPNGNYGFYISDTSVTILSVAIGTDGSSVDIALSAAPTAGSVVKYAIGETGAGGAVRDSDERDKSSFDNDFIYNFSVGKSLTINQ